MLENLVCPECGGRMVSRTNKATGQRFWGCGNYPTCKGTRNTDGEAKHGRRRDEVGAAPDANDLTPSERAARLDRRRWEDLS